MQIETLLKKSQAGDVLSKDELMYLLSLPPDAPETYQVMAQAVKISKELTRGRAEVLAQFAVNLGICNCDCLFCSFAKINNVFSDPMELTPDQAVSYATQLESQGTNAVFMMATAKYSFDKLLEIAQEVRKNLAPQTTLVANVGDQSLKDAIRLKDAGFAGVYHALRLREGKDTRLSPEKRKQSILNFKEAGLEVGTCVEPVGPEHSNEELAEMITFTASFDPAYSGSARRIAIPGTPMARLGMISELRMAQIVAITRLGMPRSVLGNCTHEPCTLGAVAGANLFWGEMGANPRDVKAKTEEGRGETVEDCRNIFWESGWDTLEGPSQFYAPGNTGA